jgi:hypothetical protein
MFKRSRILCQTINPIITVLSDFSIYCSGAHLKGLSHEIFRPIFWPVWMHLCLNVNHLWFFNFKEGSSILYSYFKYWCVSYRTFSEIRRISEKD